MWRTGWPLLAWQAVYYVGELASGAPLAQCGPSR